MMAPRLLWCFFALLFLHLTDGVDKNNFKNCEQSSFCRRLRKMAPDNSPYELDLNSVSVSKDTLTVLLINRDYNVNFILSLTSLVDSTYRITVDEKEPIKPRYRVEYVLKGEPVKDKLQLVETNLNKGYVIVTNSKSQRVILHSKPFKVEFYNQKGLIAAVINDKGLTTLEHLRDKRPPPVINQEGEENPDAEENVVEAPINEEDPGAWEENYKSHHDRKLRGPEAVSLDITFPKASHIYGIPEHADGFALRTTKDQEPYRLYNLDVFEYEIQSTMALYGAVPVVYAHGPESTTGLFLLNSAETWVDIVNSRDTDVVSSIVNFVSRNRGDDSVSARFMCESGILDAFILLGPEPQDAFKQYTELTGTAPIPQMFTLAYHQSRWNYNDEDDVRSVDDNFDLHNIPMDVIWLDIEYTDQKKYFTWDSMKFAHPDEMIANMTAKGRKMVVIIDPHIKRQPGYFVHDEATDKGYYVKNNDNKDYEGWCWPGSSSYLDFFDPQVRQYYSERYLLENFKGTSNDVHIWNDMNEPSVFNGPEVTMPKDNIHFGGWEHRHVHNIYGLLQTIATHKGLMARSQNKLRPFILTRSHFAGTQRYAAVWTGDNEADWGHLKATIPMCLSLAVAGISFCGADVGGFFKYPEDELMIRWYQLGAFQPFYRAHSHLDTKRREPWLYQPSTTNLIRDAIRKRYSYLPFWYTLFYEHSINGSPVMRPLFMHYPKITDVFGLDDQYLLGDALLVRPVTEQGVSSVTLILPGDNSDKWYDIDTYAPFGASKISVSVDISKIPIFQRGGTIIPKKERIRRSSTLMAHDPYTLVIALKYDFTAKGTLYIDDGESFDYVNGKYIYAEMVYQQNTLTYSFVNKKALYPTLSWLERVVIAGINKPPKKAQLISSAPDAVPTYLQFTYHTLNDVLVIKKPQVSMAVEWKIVLEF